MWENACNAHIIPPCGVCACLNALPPVKGNSNGAVRAPTGKIRNNAEKADLVSEGFVSQGVASSQALPKGNVESKADVDTTPILEKGFSLAGKKGRKRVEVGCLQAKRGVRTG